MSKKNDVALFLYFLWVFTACQSQLPTPAPAGSPVAQLPTAISTPTNTNTPSLTPVVLATVEPITLATVEPPPAGQPQLTLVAQQGGNITSMAVENGRLYTNEGAQLVIVDISDPTNPQELGRSQFLPAVPEQIQVLNDLAYIRLANNQLWLLDVHNPTQIKPLSRYQVEGFYPQLQLINQQFWLYWDVKRPQTGEHSKVFSQISGQQLLHSVTLPTSARNIIQIGDAVWYTTEKDNQSTVWQLSLTTQVTQLISKVPFPVIELGLHDKQLHILAKEKWLVYQFTPAGWQLKSQQKGQWDLINYQMQFMNQKDILLIGSQCSPSRCLEQKWQLYQLNPAGIKLLDQTILPIKQKFLASDQIYLQGNNSITYLTWQNKQWIEHPLFTVAGGVQDVELIGENLLYLQNEQLHNVTLVNNLPTTKTQIISEQEMSQLEINSSYLMGLDYYSGFYFFPIVEEKIIAAPPIFLEQDRGINGQINSSLFASLLSGGTIVLGKVDPSFSPSLLTILPSKTVSDVGFLGSFVLGDNWLYATENIENLSALKIWDVANPAEPILVNEIKLKQYSRLLGEKDGYLYLTDSVEFFVVDAHLPTDLKVTYSFSFPHLSHKNVILNQRAFMVGNWPTLGFQLVIFDLNNPAGPQLLTSSSLPGQILGVTANNQYIYVAAGDAGLLVFEQP